MTEQQRLSLRADVRRAADVGTATSYLVDLLRESGATVVSARGTAKKRGGVADVLADAPDAAAAMNVARKKLDADINAYALDTFNGLTLGAFRSGAGGTLGFANENYRVARVTS